ncbi:MAG: TlpA family protein disulfide reductase [Deltaproteobacteria bacterium]|nr:TlpA family protein disulfide reductase [Deltaproteobacteria bacterium]
MRHRLLVLGFGVTLAAFGCGAPAAVPPPEPKMATHATLKTLEGQTTDLAHLPKGKVTLVVLWATWCDACKRELPAVRRLDAHTKARGDSAVVAIAIGDSKDDVAAFAKANALAYEQLVDEDYALADALGERRVPATLVLSRDGKIVYRGSALDGGALAALRREIENR